MSASRAVQVALGRRELSILLVAVALYVYFLNSAVDFASTQNLQTLGTFIAATAIIAAGQVFLMISGGLTGTSEMNTGLKFVTAEDAGTYLENPSRFEGSAKEQKVIRTGT